MPSPHVARMSSDVVDCVVCVFVGRRRHREDINAATARRDI
jgi:hypothetical protein